MCKSKSTLFHIGICFVVHFDIIVQVRIVVFVFRATDKYRYQQMLAAS